MVPAEADSSRVADARERPRALASDPRAWLLAALRIVIGWHFLYEGAAKVLAPDWSAAGYLEVSRWLLADLFHWIAATPAVLQTVNFLNMWGLVLIGLGLMLGCLTRYASLAGMMLLLFYWVANPPLTGLGLGVPAEGHYLIVDKNLVEFFALALLAILPAGQCFGLDRFLGRHRRTPAAGGEGATATAGSEKVPLDFNGRIGRRELLCSLAGLPFLGAFALALIRRERWKSYEARNLVDAVTAPSAKALDIASLSELRDQVPPGYIGDRRFSRLILGGNLLSGWAHSRDLIYVSDLVKAYHTKDKIFASLLLAEKCGINTLLTNPILCTLIDEYWKRHIGRIQFISDCAGLDYSTTPWQAVPFDDYLDGIQRAIDFGACACYIQGETADHYIQHGQIDRLVKAIDRIRQNKVLVGIGAHEIETVQACVDAQLSPDFWMKTLHHHRYWSARHQERHDNIFCSKPEETVAFMANLPQPWIAFKTLAAGAIEPEDGFRFAFQNGADFVCVGMYDFQMVENVNSALEVLRAPLARSRPWRGGPLVT